MISVIANVNLPLLVADTCPACSAGTGDGRWLMLAEKCLLSVVIREKPWLKTNLECYKEIPETAGKFGSFGKNILNFFHSEVYQLYATFMSTSCHNRLKSNFFVTNFFRSVQTRALRILTPNDTYDMNTPFLPTQKLSARKFPAARLRAFLAAIIALIFVAATNDARAQFTFATDNTGNSAYSDGWQNGDNGGSGFNAWSLTTSGGGAAGFFNANPADKGISGMSNPSWGMYGNTGAAANADRSLSTAMGVGDAFSFQWGINFDTGAGNKGFSLFVGGTEVVNVNNGNSSAITFNGSNVGFNYGTAAMTWSFSYINPTTLSVSANDRDGSGTFSTNITVSGGVSAFRYYISGNNNGGNAEPLYNNLLSTNSGVFTQGGTITNNNAFSGGGNLSIGNNTTLALGGNLTYAGATTISNNSTLRLQNSGTVNFASALSGGGAIVVSNGSGQVNFSGTGTVFTGAITLANGTLEAQSANALGATNGSTTVQSGAALKLFNASTMSMASEGLTLTGTGVGGNNGALRSVGGTNTWNGAITLGGNARINADTTGGAGSLTIAGNITGGNNVLFLGANGANITLGGALSGGGASQDLTTTSIFKDGTNQLTLSGNNTYTGDTRITAGSVVVNAGGTLGSGSDVFISSGASLTINTNVTVASIRETGTGNAGTATIASGSTLTVNSDAISFFMSPINGAGGLTKSGSSTMNLYNAQGYTGTTTVNAGSLITSGAMGSTSFLLNGGSFTSSAVDGISNNATMTFGGGSFIADANDTIGALTFNSGGGTVSVLTNDTLTVGALSGSAGGLTKSGVGVLVLGSSASSYSGATVLGAGTLRLGDNAALGTSALTINGGVLASSGSTARTNANNIAMGGNVQFGDSTGTGALALNGTVDLGGTTRVLTVSNNTTFGGAISGTGGLTKSGSGALTIGANSSYSGATTVNGGTLIFNGNNTSTATTVNSGGTLAGTGSIGAVTISTGGTMNPGNSPGTQTYSSLTWEGGGNYNWQILGADGAAGTGYDTFVSTGAFAITANSGSKFNINLWSLSSTGPDVNGSANNFNSANNYTWTLGTFGSISGFSTNAFTINTGAANGTGGFANSFGGSFSINTNSTSLLLVYTAPVSNYTVTVISGAADQGAGSGITGGTNQFTGVGASLTKLGAGTLIMTNSANDYTGTTTIAEGTVSINVASPSGSAGALGNAASAVAVGTATNAVATGFNFGAAVENGRGLNIIAGNAAGGTRALSTSFGSGTATQSGAVSLGTNTAITAASGSTLLVSGALSGSGGANINGAGVVVLGTNNSGYSGTVTLSSGSTLRAGNNGALGTGGFTINDGTFASDGATARTLANNITMGGNATFGDVTGTGDLVFNGTLGLGSSTRTLTVGNTTTFAGAVGGSGGLTKAGNGTVVLSGANTFTGNVDITAGQLNVANSNAIGNTAAVTISNGATLGVNSLEEVGSLAGAGNVSLSGLLIAGGANTTTSYSGVMSGSSGFVKKGSGVMTLSGSNNYSGETYIVGGTLLFTVNQATNFNNIINIGEENSTGLASTFAIGGSGLTFTNNINVRAGDTDTATIDAQNTTGTTTLNGTLALGKAAEIRAASGGGLAINGVVSGSGNLTKTGAGSATFSANNTLTGNVDVDAGTLALSGSGSLATANRVNVGSNSILDISGVSGAGSTLKILSEQGENDGGSARLGGKVLTVNGGAANTTNYFNFLGLSGDTGGLTLNASSSSYKLVLYGASAYTGTTTVGAGTLETSAAMQSGAFVLNGGTFTTTAANLLSDTATMTFNGGGFTLGGNETIGGVTVNSNTTLSVNSGVNLTVGAMSGSGSLSKASSGTITFGAAASGYTGETIVNNGTVRVGANNALGTGTVTINFDSGTGTRELASTSATGYTLDNNFNLYYNAFTLGQSTGGTGSLVLGGAGKTFNLGSDSTETIRVVTVNGSHTIAAEMTGGANNRFAKTGTGSITLSGANSFSGGVQLREGTILVGNNAALGTGTFQVQFDEAGSKTIASSSGTAYTLANNVNIYNDFTIGQASGGTGSLTFSGATQLGDEAGTRNITAASTTSHTFSGVVSGVRGITKLGDGTLTLSGSSANTYSGLTTVSAGTLNLNKASGNAIAGATTISSGAVLLLSASNQVDSGAGDTVTLSGGTIRRGAGVSEAFGNLNITAASFLDFGTGAVAGGDYGLRFETYSNTDSALVTVNNFLPGNKLQFLAASFGAGNLAQFSFSSGYTTSTSGGYFTITAIPEPSTYLAAAGLLALFLWPVRRRLIKDVKSILGLRAPARDRLVH
jgi:fibronectin-binding autotransporter adhesin